MTEPSTHVKSKTIYFSRCAIFVYTELYQMRFDSIIINNNMNVTQKNKSDSEVVGKRILALFKRAFTSIFGALPSIYLAHSCSIPIGFASVHVFSLGGHFWSVQYAQYALYTEGKKNRICVCVCGGVSACACALCSKVLSVC